MKNETFWGSAFPILLVSLVSALVAACGDGNARILSSPPPPSQSPSSVISVAPTSTPAGGPDLTLTITGSGFVNRNIIRLRVVWVSGGVQTPLATTFDSSTQIVATVPADLLVSPASIKIVVQSYDHVEGVVVSQFPPLDFTVTAGAQSRFTPTGDMISGRSAHTATLLSDGTVLVAGGSDQLGSLNTAELYNPVDGTFSATGSLLSPRQNHTATLLPNGKVLIVGGADNVGSIASAELYDPATGKFSSLGSMGTPRSGHSASLLSNGKVLLAGGLNSSEPQSSAELFDPAAGSFSPIANMASARTSHTATALTDGRVLITGGRSQTAVLGSAEVFDPSSSTFAIVGSMNVPRYLHSSALLPNGKVLIIGGSKGLFSTPVIEGFDAASQTFAIVGNLAEARNGPTVTLLPTPGLLTAGGVDAFSGLDAPEHRILGTCELVLPHGESTSTFSLSTPRAGHTATLLLDGRVLIAGGRGNNGVLASAELFK